MPEDWKKIMKIGIYYTMIANGIYFYGHQFLSLDPSLLQRGVQYILGCLNTAKLTMYTIIHAYIS